MSQFAYGAARLDRRARQRRIQYGYDPYGVAQTTGVASTNPDQFTGRENDQTAAGLMYYRARYYNPAWGRFVSEDPIGIRGGTNLYAYAANNPLSYRDPSGNCPWCIGVGATAGAALDLLYQLYENNGNISCISWSEVAGSAFAGALIGAGFEGPAAAEADAQFFADFDAAQVQSKFKHAPDFGVPNNYNSSNAQKFVDAMSNHMDNATPITGTYRGSTPVTHYFDPTTNLNVMTDASGKFISGWKLSPDQVINLLGSGNVQ